MKALRRTAVTAAAGLLGLGTTACRGPDWPPDPTPQASEVWGRIWFCTPGGAVDGAGSEKAPAVALTTEIVAGADDGGPEAGRFPPGTVLGQSTVHPGEVWSPGSVHELPVVWVQPGVGRSDLERPDVRVRVTRTLPGPQGAEHLDPWVFSFFISLDVVAVSDVGKPEITWHLAVVSTQLTADAHRPRAVDSAFSELGGWPHACTQP